MLLSVDNTQQRRYYFKDDVQCTVYSTVQYSTVQYSNSRFRLNSSYDAQN